MSPIGSLGAGAGDQEEERQTWRRCRQTRTRERSDGRDSWVRQFKRRCRQVRLTKEERGGRGGLGYRHRKVRTREKRGSDSKSVQHIQYSHARVVNCILCQSPRPLVLIIVPYIRNTYAAWMSYCVNDIVYGKHCSSHLSRENVVSAKNHFLDASTLMCVTWEWYG